VTKAPAVDRNERMNYWDVFMHTYMTKEENAFKTKTTEHKKQTSKHIHFFPLFLQVA
jgi:hypothetical protein